MALPHQPQTPRDGNHLSPWQEGLQAQPSTDGRSQPIYDAIIVGGGITGLSTALLLQQSGKKTLLLEAHKMGFGTTGGTSAHINTFADTTFAEAESAFGADGAQLFADAIAEGADLIKNQIRRFHIDCDYSVKTGYLYAESNEEVKLLEEIFEGAQKVGVPVEYTEDVPTPVPFQRALAWEDQAQFHPLKYLQGLQAAYVAAGGQLLENTLVTGVETVDGVHTVQSAAGTFQGRVIVYATHMPPNINLFNFECAPYRSYVLAVKLKSGKYPDALIYDSQEPYHYVRSHVIDGEELLLAGGLDHKTGHDDPEKAFADLEKYIRKYYNVSSVKYRWSSQYYVPVDGLPYIGQMPLAAAGIYCATGYNGNGMMLGSVAAKLISDLVLGKENKYEKLFSPGRVKPIDSFSEFVKENADVAYRFVADRFRVHETDSINKLNPGTGKVVEVHGTKIAAYKDEAGMVHSLSPVCTHAGCIVNWNGEEKSWDCPCHGARFDIDGNVLTGPATKNLSKIDQDEN